MIQNYDSSCVYEIFEIQDTGKKYKIGEIENQVFYDLNKKGKRLEHGYQFRNDSAFWNQFKNISIKKISRPLGGYEQLYGECIGLCPYWLQYFWLLQTGISRTKSFGLLHLQFTLELP